MLNALRSMLNAIPILPIRHKNLFGKKFVSLDVQTTR